MELAFTLLEQIGSGLLGLSTGMILIANIPPIVPGFRSQFNIIGSGGVICGFILMVPKIYSFYL